MSQYDKCLTGPFLLLRLPSISIVSLSSQLLQAQVVVVAPPSPRERKRKRKRNICDKKSLRPVVTLSKPQMPRLTKLYTMAEASEHNTKDDCWVVIDGKVYDVSSYLDDHPGGDDVVLAATGRDATEDFEDAGHSKSAKELMETFCIGELDTSAIPELEIISKKRPRDYAQKLVELTKQYWVVPTTVVGVSVVVGFLYLRKK